jgi:hypothetical protein
MNGFFPLNYIERQEKLVTQSFSGVLIFRPPPNEKSRALILCQNSRQISTAKKPIFASTGIPICWKNKVNLPAGRPMKQTLLLALLILQGLTAWSQSSDIELTPAEQLLEKDILSAPGGVVSLAKPLRVYSYFTPATDKQGVIHPNYQTPESRLNQTVSDISYYAGAFWNLENHTTNLVNGGPGMYFAIDPSISTKYGNSAYVVTFPVGTRYIDVSDPTWTNVSKIKLSSATIPALINEGIIKQSDVKALAMHKGYFTRISMQMIAAVGNEKYRNTISRIFAKNQITLVQYTWESTKLKLVCKKASPSAFVLIGEVPAAGAIRAQMAEGALDNAVFMASPQYQVQYNEPEQHIVDLTMRFRQALQAGNKSTLSGDDIAEIKDVTFGCE